MNNKRRLFVQKRPHILEHLQYSVIVWRLREVGNGSVKHCKESKGQGVNKDTNQSHIHITCTSMYNAGTPLLFARFTQGMERFSRVKVQR